MGWLRKLMLERPSSIRSYGELARATLVNPIWQEKSKPQERSLAALFSKFDRGLELEWLADRQPVQYAMAAALACPIAEISSAVHRQLRGVDDANHRFRFQDVRYARPLDLIEEPLPPGIPELVQQPAEWGTVWWNAGPHSGRSLVGRWLAARGLASYINVDGWDLVSAALPARGPVFIELRDQQPAPGLPPTLRNRQLCVAGQLVEPTKALARYAAPEGFHIVDGEQPSVWLDPLVDWLALRLPKDGHFEAEFARQWLGSLDQQGLVADWGTALGMLGLLDELGAREVRGATLSSLAERWVKARLDASLAEDTPGLEWLLRQGFGLVVALVRMGLLQSERPLARTRPEHAWIRLVPDELHRALDGNWLRASLPERALQTTRRDVEKALAELPPGAYRIVRALGQSDVLRREDTADGAPAHTLGPSWLFDQALNQAVEQLCSSTALEWGEAFLRPPSAPAIADALLRRASQGDFAFVEQVLELDAIEQPAEALAFEAAFRAVGVALILGSDVPRDELDPLWAGQMQLAIRLPRGISPRFGETAEPRLAPLLDLGTWYVACWAISELSAPRHGVFALAPWAKGEPSPHDRREIGLALDAVEAALPSWPREWQKACLGLLTRLDGELQTRGIRLEHRVFAPGRIVGAATRGQLVWSRIAELSANGPPTPSVPSTGWAAFALQHLAELEGSSWPRVAQAMWYAWLYAGMPRDAGLLSPDAPCAAAFWPELPGQVLYRMLVEHTVELGKLRARLLRHEHWRLLVEHWSTVRAELGAAAVSLLAELPSELIAEALGSPALTEADGEVLRAFWLREPELALSHLRAQLERGEAEPIELLLRFAPPAQTTQVVHTLTWLLQHAARPEQQWLGLGWLHDRVAARAPGWQSAYDLLSELAPRCQRTDPTGFPVREQSPQR